MSSINHFRLCLINERGCVYVCVHSIGAVGSWNIPSPFEYVCIVVDLCRVRTSANGRRIESYIVLVCRIRVCVIQTSAFQETHISQSQLLIKRQMVLLMRV